MVTKSPDFQLLDHTADLGMIVRGKDIEDLFISGAKALTQTMVRSENQRPTRETRISVDGHDLTDLFIRWLGEILYLFEGEGLIFCDTRELKISSSTSLQAIVLCVPFDPDKHEIVYEIKAVTYHQASVNRAQGGWEAKVIFDL
ncbi:MAG: archease [Deltaproteobacteria bacterium]|nr:MAG: archease [Deltaproteobacteria bacterium]